MAGGFGLAHGLGVWGYLFIPIQSGFLPAALIEALLWVQLACGPGVRAPPAVRCGALLTTRTAGDAAPTSRLGIPWLRLVAPIAVLLWAWMRP